MEKQYLLRYLFVFFLLTILSVSLLVVTIHGGNLVYIAFILSVIAVLAVSVFRIKWLLVYLSLAYEVSLLLLVNVIVVNKSALSEVLCVNIIIFGFSFSVIYMLFLPVHFVILYALYKLPMVSKVGSYGSLLNICTNIPTLTAMFLAMGFGYVCFFGGHPFSSFPVLLILFACSFLVSSFALKKYKLFNWLASRRKEGIEYDSLLPKIAIIVTLYIAMHMLFGYYFYHFGLFMVISSILYLVTFVVLLIRLTLPTRENSKYGVDEGYKPTMTTKKWLQFVLIYSFIVILIITLLIFISVFWD